MPCVFPSPVIVNDSLTKEFDILRGVCQGVPLSYFLFIITIEGLCGLEIGKREKIVFRY